MIMPLKKVTVYLTEEEYAAMASIAVDEDVRVSAVLRAKLGLVYKRQGAPEGNTNRRKRSQINGKNNCRRPEKIRVQFL
jgi:hypothetical protein